MSKTVWGLECPVLRPSVLSVSEGPTPSPSPSHHPPPSLHLSSPNPGTPLGCPRVSHLLLPESRVFSLSPCSRAQWEGPLPDLEESLSRPPAAGPNSLSCFSLWVLGTQLQAAGHWVFWFRVLCTQVGGAACSAQGAGFWLFRSEVVGAGCRSTQTGLHLPGSWGT